MIERDYHELLLSYLLELHKRDNNFLFQVRRTNRNERLTDGFWFNGTTNNTPYIETSFWEYRDDTHQTPTIRLGSGYNEEGWTLELVARENPKKSNADKEEIEQRRIYFEKMASEIGGFQKDAKLDIWRKKLPHSNFLKSLHDFIENDKPLIDEYLRQNLPNPEIKIKIGFIKPEDFEKQLKRVNEEREPNEHFEKAVPRLIQLIEKANKIMPFTLTYLGVKNYQGIKSLISEDEEGNGIELNSQWIFLTGENGFGKTSILRAIAKGLVGDDDKPHLSDESAIIVGGLCNNEPFFNKVKPRYPSPYNIPVVGYGVSRFIISNGNTITESRSTGQVYSLFEDDGQLKNIEQELKDTSGHVKPRFEALKKGLEQVLQNKISIDIDIQNAKPVVIYTEKATEQETYGSVKLSDLAAGYRSIFTMIGDMLLRFLPTNSSNLDDVAGIVLIDEIDAHLHPKYQYELPNILSNLFPKVQFIVTTHSPIPILGLGADNSPIIFKVNRTIEEGITMDRKDDNIELDRISLSALLSSDIFGKYNNILPRGVTQDTIIPFNPTEDTLKERLTDMQDIVKKLKLKPIL